ncbi:hypothetical protein CWI42_030780 [Ordospora colligata]|uniref:Uncharacterized protein n=1 Tax=Ordospora colligata OC4 TaxID=1354746 RepID=A0A0B2UL19_9MICR|nr:uncharacterized protein M896_030490 [Ordospora colligata OC4]KHN70063.1 hypothetical protein M896_030490 [Ordospora colligata OC4]TBU16445.1 hypothetical protein CWI41_030450 [Ordospora colligata]TBU16630.1 hypothetical protein CWI40_030850 [Ordospora colligata]TBU19203.1 hypothetical protein CWI42_030780 [Ordospora colligata]
MITSIGIIPSKIEIDKLKEFQADKEIAKSLEHLNIPLIDKSAMTCDYDVDESEDIVEGDVLIFCTPNEEDVSFLQIYIQNKECVGMFMHHDTYVFSSVIDSENLNIGGTPYIALGTFENDIFVYDPLVRSAMLPQILLKGHSDAVMSLRETEGKLFSGSYDSSIIEWDTKRLEVRNKINTAGPVSKIDASGSIVVYSVANSLHCFEQEIGFESDIEKIKMVGDRMFISDSSGKLWYYDIRNMSNAVLEKKIHDDSIASFDIFEKSIYTASLDGTIKVLDIESFDVRYVKKADEKVFSIKVCEEGFFVYGGEQNMLKMVPMNASTDGD